MAKREIPKELFVYVDNRGASEQTSLPVSNKGFFREAFSRFRRMRISAIALGVILFIALFSVLTPLIISRPDDFMDPYYAKMGPRYAPIADTIGIMHGARTRRLGERGLIRMLAIGVGAFDSSGAVVTPNEADGGKFTPLLSSPELNGRTYEARVDSYLEVGFIYKTVEREEYARILDFEEKTGLSVLYPLVADNEFNADADDANMWYKTNERAEPVSVLTGGETVRLEYSPDMLLEDNYLRDGEGNIVYKISSGGGDFESSGYKIRVLYYNYHRYLTGSEPNYVFGTDSQGYDMALRLASGIRLSLLIALAVSVINFIIGALVGAVEGYYGGAVDMALERVTDILSGVPFIVVATLFQIYLGGRLGPIPSLLFAFVLTGWLGTANRVRAQFYRFKGAEYVMAARTLGASDARIIWRHIFPNTLGTLITASALVIPGVIFSESMLSFLGIMNLGGEDATSLGTLLSEAGGVWTNYPHLILFPAACISLLMISFNLFGNGLRDAFNPAGKGVGAV